VPSATIDAVQVYPNPAEGTLTITGLSEFNYMILHSTGTLAKTGFEDVTKQITITDLRQGTYIIDIQPDNYSNKIMFVKK
jgi:hypothetical protein